MILGMDELKINYQRKVKSSDMGCNVRNDGRGSCAQEEAKSSLSDCDADRMLIVGEASQSLNQCNHIPEENQQNSRSAHMTIDISSCLRDDNEEVSRSCGNKSPVKKFDNANRRAKIFDSCKVKSPLLVIESPGSMAGNKLYYPSISETLEEMKKENGDKFSSLTSQQRTIPDPFQFPHRPIEQMTLLNCEVELERQSAKRKQTLKSKSSSDSVTDSFTTERESNSEKKRRLSPPEFDKLNFEGDNVSGVLRSMQY